MCTLTWWAGESGYEIFFNRDEKKDRPVATPPELSEKNGVRFLAPRDTGAGGTWILVNEFGVTFTLLNWYSRKTVPPLGQTMRSRGRLVTGLGDVRNPGALAECLTSFESDRFRPFRLLGFFPGKAGLEVDYWQWSGVGAFEKGPAPPMPVCSSSFDRDAVIEKRETVLKKAIAKNSGPETHWSYHHNLRALETSAYTVRMNRPDAQTWSVSRITVEQDQVRFLYEAEAPGLAAEPEVFESSLRRVSR